MLTEKETPSIPSFFNGKSVFITGGSGFIGKLLIEKLLRDCSGIRNIFVLIREKKGLTPPQRIEEIVSVPLFEKLREKDSHAVKKIIPIYGDAAKINLGISEEDKATLISKANVVYHCAASVRFDDHLKDAILTNIRSTREVITLAKQFKHLDVYVHVSTIYCNIRKRVVAEEIDPAAADWRDAVYTAENVDERILQALTLKCTQTFPNTYTYTKHLAERAVEDLCGDQIPAVICRPSIVVASVKEPIPGWIDNFNGPFALATAILKGLISCIYGDPSVVQDMVHVDNVVKSLIVAAWEKALTKAHKNKVKIYNTSGDIRWQTRFYRDFTPRLNSDVPFVNRLWYGENSLSINWYYYYTCFVIFNLIPGLLLDGVLKISGKKTRLLKLIRRVYIGNMAVAYFLKNSWTFKNDEYVELEKKLLEEDKPIFLFRPQCLTSVEDIYAATKQNIMGVRKFILRETPTEQTYKNTYRMYLLDRAVKLISFGWLFYWILWKCDIINVITTKVCDYFDAL